MKHIITGILSASVLGSLFFALHINNLDGNVGEIISSFADNTKTAGVVGNRKVSQAIE